MLIKTISVSCFVFSSRTDKNMESFIQEVEVLESVYSNNIDIDCRGTSLVHGTVNQFSRGDLAITFRIEPEDTV